MTYATDTIVKKTADTEYDIHPLIAERFSPRIFDPTRLIPADDLLSLFEAARWAPSSRNVQPWRFMLATRQNMDAFERVLHTLKEGNQRWAKDAAALVIVLTRPNLEDGRSNTHAWHDAGLAVANLTLEATARDIYVHQMGGIRRDAMRDTFTIPPEFDIVSAIALGYRGPVNKADDEVAARETRPRSRHPLAELLFTTDWATPYQP